MNIIGRVTRDAEVRTLSNEKQVVNFSVAVNDSYKNKQGERIEQTAYFDCAFWLNANVAQILTKGALVELTGRASARAWIGNDGQPKASLNFNTSRITLHAGGQKQDFGKPAESSSKGKGSKKEEHDDLPF